MNIRQLSSEELTNRIRETGIERAKAESEFIYYSEYRKIILEQISLEIQETEDISAAKALSRARISSVFKQAVDEMVVATERKFLAYANYKECDFEIKRRLNASFSKNREFSAGNLNT
ncbi:MAG: hypothetical protein KAS32_07200 [Candidatus Peribacteraceae bacterium]|nr:hypothetical protein [Candidatus Peribacteraceae bacterium]